MGDDEQIAALFAEVDDRFGRLDLFVNNVGHAARSRPELAVEHKLPSDYEARVWIEGVGDAERRLEITPARAGWDFLSFRTYTFRRGQVIAGESAGDEMCLVLLSGSITMETAAQPWSCDGRASVFDRRPYAVSLPPGRTSNWPGCGTTGRASRID